MKILKWSAVCVLMVFAGGCTDTMESPSLVNETDRTSDRDNTGVNTRDRRSDATTPMDQSNKKSDIDQVAQIRSSVLEIKDLSVYGRNVKIITDEGKVVLRGPVASESERAQIAMVAEKIAGPGNVTNLLEVDKK